MNNFNKNEAVLVTAPSAVGMPSASRSEVEKKAADAVLPPDSLKSISGIVSTVHDNRVRNLLDQVMEFNKDNPGVLKSIRLVERTLVAFMPDDGDKALDEFEQHGSSQVQVLRNVCGGSMVAIIGKESFTDFNVADSEQ